MKKLKLLALSICTPILLTAQLSGTYTIGGALPDYLTINAALDTLDSVGVAGPVIFEIRDGIYTEQLLIGPISGASDMDRITFRSGSEDSSLVIVEWPGNNVWLDSAQFMNFMGITFKATGTDLSRIVRIEGTTNDILFESCVFDAFDTPSVFDSRVVEFWGSYPSSNMIFRNDLFSSGAQGLFVYGGGTSNPGMNNVIEGNHFIGQRERAALVQVQEHFTFQNNHIMSQSTTFTGCYYMQWCSDSTHILANQLEFERGYGFHLDNSDGTASAPILFANNMISCEPMASGARGVYLDNSNFIHSYYNSVNIHGSNATSIGFQLAVSSFDQNNKLMNNCLVNNANGQALNVMGATFFETSDHNDFYSSGSDFGSYNGTTYGDLTSWQTATSADANSLNIMPTFVSNTDLHVTGNELNGMATALSDVLEDFDGEVRDLLMPDIGADEKDATVDISGNDVQELELLVHPNPTNGVLFFNVEGIERISCSDLMGRTVELEYSTGATRIDLSFLPNGVYILEMEKDGMLSEQRVIKQ